MKSGSMLSRYIKKIITFVLSLLFLLGMSIMPAYESQEGIGEEAYTAVEHDNMTEIHYDAVPLAIAPNSIKTGSVRQSGDSGSLLLPVVSLLLGMLGITGLVVYNKHIKKIINNENYILLNELSTANKLNEKKSLR